MLESEKEFECQNQRCRCHFKVKADIEQGGIMEVPVFHLRCVHNRPNVPPTLDHRNVNPPFSSLLRYELIS